VVAVVAGVALGLGSLVAVPALPGTAPSGAPAGAATAAPRLLRSVDVRLNTIASSPGTNEHVSSPALADLTHPGDHRPELVVAAPNGTVTATRVDTGARLWQASLGPTVIHASPVVVDVDNDGRVDVVVATMDGRVVLLDGQSGAVKRTFRQGADLHCPGSRPNCRPTGFFATPVVADVNGDGRNDIVAPSFDHTVYAWSWGGTLLWRSFLQDTLWSSPAVVDVDRNGTAEVVLGGDIYAGNPLGVPAGGLLWTLDGRNGARFKGRAPRSLPGQTIWSSPAVTDLDGDGSPDVVVGTGNNGPFGDGSAQRKVWGIRLSSNGNLPGWPVTPPGRVVHQPAVGDVDGDGRPEVVVATETAHLRAYEHTGAVKWTTCNYGTTSSCDGGVKHTHGGVAIADVDDDGVQEVLSALTQRLRVYDGRTSNAVIEADVRLTGGNGILNPASIVAVGEVNGSTVIAQSYVNRDAGATGAPQPGRASIRTDLLTTDEPLCAEDWPGFKRDARRTSIRPTRPPWHPFRCGRPFVAQQYRDLLGRDLDASGATFWTARLRTTWSGPRVVEGFMNSAEFGAVAAPVVRLHLGLTGGPPIVAAEVRAEMADLRQGTTLAALAGELLARAPYASMTDAQLVDHVFPRLMGSTPTSTQRADALAAVDSDGRGAWMAELSSSAWAVARLRGPVQVAMTYVGLLDRGPDQEGWDHWVARVAAGTRPQRLIELFLASPEYADRVL
jgi:hypothetical protein